MAQSKLWIIYDARAIPKNHLPKEAQDLIKKDRRMNHFFPGKTDDAAVLESCNSLEEAKENAKDHGDMNCIYEYDIKGKNLINEKFVQVVD